LYSWTTPIFVANPGDITFTSGRYRLSFAYDASNGAFGAAYPAGAYGEVDIALSFDGGQTGKTARAATSDYNDIDFPEIALGGGKAYLAFGDLGVLRYMTGSQKDDVSTWTAQNVTTIDIGDPRYVALKVDSAGNQGLVYLDNGGNYNTRVFFWRPTWGAAVRVGDTNNCQNDDMDAALDFDGVKPRIEFTAIRDDGTVALGLRGGRRG
jgi:hypothetical protein